MGKSVFEERSRVRPLFKPDSRKKTNWALPFPATPCPPHSHFSMRTLPTKRLQSRADAYRPIPNVPSTQPFDVFERISSNPIEISVPRTRKIFRVVTDPRFIFSYRFSHSAFLVCQNFNKWVRAFRFCRSPVRPRTCCQLAVPDAVRPTVSARSRPPSCALFSPSPHISRTLASKPKNWHVATEQPLTLFRTKKRNPKKITVSHITDRSVPFFCQQQAPSLRQFIRRDAVPLTKDLPFRRGRYSLLNLEHNLRGCGLL